MKNEVRPDSPPLARPPRSRGARFLKYWLPVLIWAAIIFGFSTDAGSSRRTSRIIGPILRWFSPSISDEAIHGIQTVVRKGGHLTEYAILAVLVWRALQGPEIRASTGRNPSRKRSWIWRPAGLAFAAATLFAVTDEWHQSTVPSRQGQVSDVLIDATGAATGLAMVGLLRRRRAAGSV